ncbi:MAG: MFS transporter [Acidimicrobiia bacterium]|nr:MFS transporter [Acidimicrobiia bacterium]
MRGRPDRLFLLTGGAQGFTWAAGLPVVVWWVVELQLPPLRLALLGTALVLTILVAEAPTGVLADLYGRKPSVVASFAVMGAAIGLMASSPAFASMMVWQAVWALGWTMQSGAATAWVTDELLAGSGPRTADGSAGDAGQPDSSETGDGAPGAARLDQLIVRQAIWRAIGLMIGLGVAAGVGAWSLRGAMVVAGALGLAFAAYLAVTMTETAFIQDTRIGASAGGAWREALTIWRQGAALALRRRTLLAVVSAAAITGFAGEAIERLEVLRLVELGLPDYTGGEAVLLFGVVWFVMAALSIPVMIWLRRRLGRRDASRDARLLARLLIVAGAGALALAVSPIFAVALAGWTVLDVAGETTYPLAEAMANREASSGVRATVISFLGQAEALGQVFGGVTLGLVAQFVSLPIALATAAGLLAVAAIPVAVVGRAQPASAR